ncbi:MAG: acetyl esterase/lipase/peptidoglycan/xylan/chitin deacetylase (PgdA/CDA1 family) [Candidatus Binatia bacterium]|jgi:acetyl esterase/lipase/peptidoglycan/xylan/chitin deacetylase (PgdA/CDA1 family)
MLSSRTIFACGFIAGLILAASAASARALDAIPDKLVVLTFDDSVKSHYTVVRPILKKHGFGATFFITEGFDFKTDKQRYLTWEEIAELHRDGFEIGNHTRDHMGLSPGKPEQLKKQLARLPEQIEAINVRCKEYGIPRPVSFAYPGNGFHPDAFAILKKAGIRFARRGGAPEYDYALGRGFAFEPGADHPLRVPSAADARPAWTFADFKRGVDQAKFGRIAVLQFHGVPDEQHPWVNTKKEDFEEFMAYLAKNHFRVIALRDLENFVNPNVTPANPNAVIERRKQAIAAGDVSRYFDTLATEGPGPRGFPNTLTAKLAVGLKQIPLVDVKIADPADVQIERGVEYGRGSGRPLQLDLYSPTSLKTENPVPGLIFIHGGAWRGGKRGDYHFYGVKFAQRGYVVATISYRLLREAPFPAAVQDAKCAVRWMRANAAKLGVDPDRIAVAGGSAGGHLSMMVGYSSDVAELEGAGGHAGVSSRVQAVVNLYGPADLTTPFGVESSLVKDFLGGRTFAEAPEAYRLASPMTHLSRNAPPTLIFHGTIDDTVPIAQADLLAERLKALGIPFRYDRLDGWPHALDVTRVVNERARKTMLEFFAEHLASGR